MYSYCRIIGIICLLSTPALAGEAVDGDTIRVGQERIRVLDLDTPEIRGKCDAERRLARLAKSRLQALLDMGYTVERKGKDRYQRTLAHVWIGSEKASDILVREGYARTLFWEQGERRKPWCE